MSSQRPRPNLAVLLGNALVATLIVMIPFNSEFLILIDDPTPEIAARLLTYTYIGPIDLIFVALILLVVVSWFRKNRRLPSGVEEIGSIVVAGAILFAVLIEPSPSGWMQLLRFAGAAATVATVRSASPRESDFALVWVFAVSASFQALLALGQTFVWDTGRLGRDDLAAAGELWTAGLGTFTHEYTLAAYLSLAVAVVLASGAFAPLRWYKLIPVGLASAAVATSFGRSAALSILALGAAYGVGWLIHRRKDFLLSASVPTVSFAFVAALASSAWATRAGVTSAIRLQQARQALDVALEYPLLGIGPMRYGPYIDSLGLPEDGQFIVHSVPLIVMAEYGLIAGFAFVGWLVAVGLKAIRASVHSAALFLVALPYMLFDHPHYLDPGGIAMFGLWLGMVGVIASTHHPGDLAKENESHTPSSAS